MRWIEFHDSGPDEEGRRRFTLHWLREGELPGTPSTFSMQGTRRSQVFFCLPERFADAVVVTQAPWERT